MNDNCWAVATGDLKTAERTLHQLHKRGHALLKVDVDGHPKPGVPGPVPTGYKWEKRTK